MMKWSSVNIYSIGANESLIYFFENSDARAFDDMFGACGNVDDANMLADALYEVVLYCESEV